MGMGAAGRGAPEAAQRRRRVQGVEQCLTQTARRLRAAGPSTGAAWASGCARCPKRRRCSGRCSGAAPTAAIPSACARSSSCSSGSFVAYAHATLLGLSGGPAVPHAWAIVRVDAAFWRRMLAVVFNWHRIDPTLGACWYNWPNCQKISKQDKLWRSLTGTLCMVAWRPMVPARLSKGPLHTAPCTAQVVLVEPVCNDRLGRLLLWRQARMPPDMHASAGSWSLRRKVGRLSWE